MKMSLKNKLLFCPTVLDHNTGRTMGWGRGHGVGPMGIGFSSGLVVKFLQIISFSIVSVRSTSDTQGGRGREGVVKTVVKSVFFYKGIRI